MNRSEVRLIPPGQTRSKIAPEYALITADTHVRTPMLGGHRVEAAVHISPEMGARFLQQSIWMDADSSLPSASAGVERFLYVVDGEIELAANDHLHELEEDDYAFLPADGEYVVTSDEGARLACFEKIYEPLDDRPLEAVLATSSDIPDAAYEGDNALTLQSLLPDDQRFDMAVNLFSYEPGATLPQVEIHVMEHGLQMLDGAGVYRLADAWHIVEAGDVIWMASYCPQWFVAMGKTSARYLYYKDVNRDPLAGA